MGRQARVLTIALAICWKQRCQQPFNPSLSLVVFRAARGTYSLARRVDLRGVTTTRDPDANVHVGKLVGAEEQDGLVELRPEDLGGKELEGPAVDLDQALARHTASDGCDIVRNYP